MGNVKLKRLKIEKYRNVAPGTELVFNDGFNVLLGQNGTGKTTLLNLIAMVTASRFVRLRDTEFSLSYTLEFSGTPIDITIENVRNDFDTSLNEAFSWSYRVGIKVNQPSQSQSFRVSANATQKLMSSDDQPEEKADGPANPFEQNIVQIAVWSAVRYKRAREQNDSITTLLLLLNFESHNTERGRRFDEVLGGLDSITGIATSTDTPAASVQLIHLARSGRSRDRELATFVPSYLLEIMRDRVVSSRSIDGIVVEHEDIDFLKKAVELMGFKKAHMLLRLRKREPIETGEKLTFGDFEFKMTLDDETVITHDLLSYGQKRLLAFLYYVATNDDIVIADEIVNGMHYDWIEACLREIGDRQSFLTSQNPLLLDFLPFKSEQDVEHTFILCGNEQRDGRRHIVWKNMSEEDAHTFFRSYKTQALQVSEILRSRGWW